MPTDELLERIDTALTDPIEHLFQVLHDGLGVNRDVAQWVVDAALLAVNDRLVPLALQRPESFDPAPACGPDEIN